MNKIIILSMMSCFAVFSCVSSEKSVQNMSSSDRTIASQDYYADLFSETAESCSIANFQNCNKRKSARELSSVEIQEISSTANLNLGANIKSAELIIDNDQSFDRKLQAIRNAKNEIRMVYYIYTNDDSSALITSELIQKAQAGVKVKLLVDFITNFNNFDLFSMMAIEGRGNIDIRFYNFPSERILRDAVFTTLPCPAEEKKPSAKACYKHKEKQLESLSENSTFFSKLFLAGLYGKSATALKVSMGLGAQVSKETFATKEGEESLDFEKIKDFFELLIDAKLKKNFLSIVKLQFAMIAYSSQINPLMNEITGRLPVINDSKPLFSTNASHADEWDHLTDYVHHKLIVVDGSEFQLGGRNIEDSYHMKTRVTGAGKYIFKDTDFHAKTKLGGAKQIEASFDRMFNFGDMVASIQKVAKYAPYKYIANSSQLGLAAQSCGEQLAKGAIKNYAVLSCLDKSMKEAAGFMSDSDRYAKIKLGLEDSISNYNSLYIARGAKRYTDTWKDIKNSDISSSFSASLSDADLKQAELYYIENTPYDVKAKTLSRRVGAVFKRDQKYNKNIHQLWYKELENSCRVSQNEQRDVRVVFHNAYLMLPAGLTYTLAKMMNGSFGDCSRVKVTFLTNSFETTDLNVVNIFSRYQMIQLFKYYTGLVNYEKTYLADPKKNRQYKKWFPKLEYFEYKAAKMGAGISLHTKLAVFENDLFIGSANLDVRSYLMDTNNGILIRNAMDLKKDYLKYIDNIINDVEQSKDLSADFAAYSEDQVKAENNYIIAAMLKRWDKKNKINDKKRQVFERTISGLGSHIAFATYKLLTYKGGEDYVDMFNENDKFDSETRGSLRKISNEFNDLFKVL